jgi:tetratricopeptide (TPR) repeat protein
MRCSIPSSVSRAALTVALLCAFLPARAQEAAPADAPTMPPEQQARAQFELGQRQYDLGRFDRAIAHYARAYELLPLPAFLFNIAQSHRQRGEHRQAAFFYRRYLDLAQNPANAGLARTLLAEMEQAQGLPAPDETRPEVASAVNEPPLYRRRWVWFAAVGLVAASATAATVQATRPHPTTLGTVNAR